EGEGDAGTAFGDDGEEVVQCGDDDGGCDDRFGEAARQANDVEGGQREGDGVCQREGSDDLEDTQECGAGTRDGLPVAVAPQQHRWQQQRDQEQQMVDPTPDVPDAGL